ncbi:MAG: MFS transporter [Chloroflexi bacterium]|nr:MFS transporter [Chloroflexota bacterium]
MLLAGVLGRRRPFYGWVIVASSFVNQVINTGLGFQGFGTFFVPLQQEFGWNKTAISGARSAMQVESGVVDPFVGFLVDRWGPRPLMTLGTFLFGLGMVLFSFIHSLWAYYAVFVLIALGSSLGGFLVMTVAINNWFRRRRTLAVALAQLGLGVGGIAVIPLLVWAQTSFGWRTATFWGGLSVWAVGIPAALLMRRAPELYGQLPDGDRAAPPTTAVLPVGKPHAPSAASGDFSLREALHTHAFWFIGFGHGLSVMVVGAITVHQFAHMEQGVGLSRSAAAIVVTVLSASNIVGRLVAGMLGDHVPKRYLSAAGMLGSAVALVVLAFATSLGQAMVFGVLHGFCWGMRGPLMSAIRGEYFGRSSYGRIAGMTSLLTSSSALVGPIFAGVMADLMGDYRIGFVVLATISGAGCVLFFLARPPVLPPRMRRAGTAAP